MISVDSIFFPESEERKVCALEKEGGEREREEERANARSVTSVRPSVTDWRATALNTSVSIYKSQEGETPIHSNKTSY